MPTALRDGQTSELRCPKNPEHSPPYSVQQEVCVAQQAWNVLLVAGCSAGALSDAVLNPSLGRARAVRLASADATPLRTPGDARPVLVAPSAGAPAAMLRNSALRAAIRTQFSLVVNLEPANSAIATSAGVSCSSLGEFVMNFN